MMIIMINTKTIATAIFLLAFMTVAEARLNGDKTMDVVDEMHLALQATRTIKAVVGVGNNKGAKTNKNEVLDPSIPPSPMPSTSNEAADLTTMPTWIPSAHPTADPTRSPTPSPTSPPAPVPSAPPMDFDSTISVVCKPDGPTILTPYEAKPKIIICNSAKPSCREAVIAVRESMALQNFFGCAGNLGEGAARKLFNKYASDDMLAGQLALIAATNPILVTERPDAMKAACMTIGIAQSPSVANPCCQGSSGCTSVSGSASNSPPFMTIAITACTDSSACKDMGPNPLILDSSCTGASACELMNQSKINPFITGVTFVGEGACTSAQSCKGVGHLSSGDVTIQEGACIGTEACTSAGRRVAQSAPSFRYQSHIHIGSKACVGSNACRFAHSTVSHFPGGKIAGSLTIGDGGCADEGSCEKLGLNDRMRTDIIVPPGGCGGVQSCWACMTKTECKFDEVYLISDVGEACPKGGRDTNFLPTGDKVEEYCVGKDELPTECPTFFPTPFPTVSVEPTSVPTSAPTAAPTSAPTPAPTSVPTSAPTSIPTITRATLSVGCLSTPGDGNSMFNAITGDVVCDGATGTCADFVSEVDALTDEGKSKMIKSIFGCNDKDPPQPVALQVAQKRFDKIKNDESVTSALLAIAKEDTKLFTGSGTVVTKACNGSCCRGGIDCTVQPANGGVMTVSSGSCTGSQACGRTRPNAIILDSCKGPSSCHGLGNFGGQPTAGAEVGFRVIGPRACVAGLSCTNMGFLPLAIYELKKEHVMDTQACASLAQKGIQGSTTTTPVVVSVFIGKNACQGRFSCSDVHRSDTKIRGSVIIEDGACSGANTCYGLGLSISATNDIIVRAEVCTNLTAPCTNCARGPLCASADETYVIDNAADCPGPVPSACEVV